MTKKLPSFLLDIQLISNDVLPAYDANSVENLNQPENWYKFVSFAGSFPRNENASL